MNDLGIGARISQDVTVHKIIYQYRIYLANQPRGFYRQEISVAWSSAYQINLATFHHDFWAAALCMAQYRRQLANRQMDHFIIIAMQMILISIILIIEPRILEHFSVRLHKERARSDTVQAAEKCSSDK